MVTNLVHEGAEALRLRRPPSLRKAERRGEGLLAYILNGLRGPEPGAELEVEQFRKVDNEVLLRLLVTGTETLNIVCTERTKLQLSLRNAKWVKV